MNIEAAKIIERYKKREGIDSALYSPLDYQYFYSRQERERILLKLFRKLQLVPGENSLLEIGCGSGQKLLEMILLGFSPDKLMGIDLLNNKIEHARNLLPSSLNLVCGDACQMDFGNQTFDIVYQSMAFTSILDKKFQEKLAAKMWYLLKCGGYILWYDFIYNNPKNSDVAGIPLKCIHKLFPEGIITKKHVTLAPPIGRFVTKFHPTMYTLLNSFPFLHTHVLCLIKKES